MVKHYQNLGYVKDDNGLMEIDIKDLPLKSTVKVEVECDICYNIKYLSYAKYNKNISKYKIYSCSHKCAQFKNKLTNTEKYGVDNPMKSDEIKKIVVDNNLKNHGVEWMNQLDSTKEKIKNSLVEKWGGVGNASDKIFEKMKITNLERYGVEYTSQNLEIKEKTKRTFMEKYGVENPSQNGNIQEQKRKTNLIKYGFSNPMMNAEVTKKLKETVYNKTKEKFNNLLTENYDIINYADYIHNILHKKCDNIFSINYSNLRRRLLDKIEICTICSPIGEQQSIKEKELVGWIESLNISPIIIGNRTILNGLELDIYIPSHNLAIEFNGLYHHSELFKDKNYHLNKNIKCQEKGIQLLHIWEDEWVSKQDIVKSIISNKLGLISNKIYARQCEIKVIENSKLVREFLNKNHIQGYSQSTIKLGLFYKEELVSLMTFGYRHTNAKKEFELIRFCNRINLNVIGAASKLFNYFKQNYNFKEIISYSDFRLFDGKMYETLRFEKKHLSKPDYFWCRRLERKHRFNFNKQKLIKEGFDGSKTEVEIMHERGYYRIFGCGQYKWEYDK
jgi:hypothetical protein